MNRIIASAFAFTGLLAMNAHAQGPSAAAEVRQAYARIKTNFQKAAEKMPDDAYSFQPTPEIRTFAALVAHVADSQMRTCSGLNGAMKQGGAGSKTSKAGLVAALKESFDECDKAYDSLTDSNAMQGVGNGKMQRTRLGALWGNVVHTNEEYGYIAVYMRLKKVVPPSSEGR